MRIPYERLVAWLAGPVSIVAGAAAVWLDTHFGLLGKAGLGSDQTAKAINDGLTFAIGAGLTYLGQAKWMSNLGAWWNSLKSVADQAADQGRTMTQEEQEPQEQPDEPEAPFRDEPGYDDEGPGVEPDQELDEPEQEKTLEGGEGEDVGPDTA